MAPGGVGFQRRDGPDRRGLAGGRTRRAARVPGATPGAVSVDRRLGGAGPRRRLDARSQPGRVRCSRPVRPAPPGDRHPPSRVRRRSLRGLRGRPSVRRSGRGRAGDLPPRERRGAPRRRGRASHPTSRSSAHGIPGAAIGRRALGAGSYVAKIHGSDLEYAIRPQARYRTLAREGLEAALAVVGPSAEVLRRCAELVPRDHVEHPGGPAGGQRGDVPAATEGGSPPRGGGSLEEDEATRADARPRSTLRSSGRSTRGTRRRSTRFRTYEEDVPELEAAARIRRWPIEEARSSATSAS